MRIVASACLVLALVFMVGCGTSAEDKTAIKTNTDNIAALQKTVADMQKMGTDNMNKVAAIEAFLKDKNSKFGTGAYAAAVDTTKPPVPPKGGVAPKTPPAGGEKKTTPAAKPPAKKPGEKG